MTHPTSKFLTVIAVALALTPAAAFAKSIKNTPFVHFYLDCEKSKAEALNQDLKQLPCVQKVAVHYCSIYDALPKDVQTSLSLELYCNFVASEQNGDAERDARLMEAVEAAGCFKGTEARQALFKKHAESPDELDALQNFTAKLVEQEAACEIPIEHRRAKQVVEEEIHSNAPKTTDAKKYEERKKAVTTESAKPAEPEKTEAPKSEEVKPEPAKKDAQ